MDGRNNSFFSNITWNNNQLAFTITAPTGARNLNAMLPSKSGTTTLLSLIRNGASIPFSIQTIKGMAYVFFDVITGTDSYIAYYGGGLLITTQPASQSICQGSNVSFSSAATGTPPPAVQWQQSFDGVNWTDVNGATNATLTFTPAQSDNNKQYHAVWTNSNGSVTSNAATLTINATPLLTSTLTPTGINSGTVFYYTPVSNTNGTTFRWSRTTLAGISNAAANGTGNINETLFNTTNAAINVTYVYTLTANNCINTQNVVVQVYPLPEGCSMNTSISANFNGTPISSGRYIWFSSVFKAGNISNRIVNFTITNSRITYTLNNQLVTLNVPDGHIKFDPATSSANTNFTNSAWETKVPAGTTVNVFMAGLSYHVPANLPGGIKNVKWMMDIQIDKDDVSLDWKWTAGVYTNFAGNAGLNIKPTDGLLSILNPLLGVANAGTPLNYSLNIIAGAMGSGLLNITNTYTSTTSLSCASTNSKLLTRQIAPQSSPVADQPTFQNASEIRIQPNPAAGHFDIFMNRSAADIVTVRVLDILGRVVERYQKPGGEQLLQIGYGLKAGTYFAELTYDNQRKIFKIIKVN